MNFDSITVKDQINIGNVSITPALAFKLVHPNYSGTGNAPTGPTGAQGASITGPTGEPGRDSTVTGPTGSPGRDSTVTGPTGSPGRDSTVTGPTGSPGRDSTVTGPTGERGRDSTVTGPTGAQGTSGGQVIFLDSVTQTFNGNTFYLMDTTMYSTPTSYNIVIPKSTSNVLVRQFVVNPTLTPSILTAGVWDVNIWASANTGTTLPTDVSFYYTINIINASGNSVSTLATGQIINITGTNVITEYVASSYVSTTSIPTGNNIAIYMYVNNNDVNHSHNFTIYWANASYPSHVHTSLATAPGPTGPTGPAGSFSGSATGTVLFYAGAQGVTGTSNFIIDSLSQSFISGGTQTYYQTSYGSGATIGTNSKDFSGLKGSWRNVNPYWATLSSIPTVKTAFSGTNSFYFLGEHTAQFYHSDLNYTLTFQVEKGGGGGGGDYGYINFYQDFDLWSNRSISYNVNDIVKISGISTLYKCLVANISSDASNPTTDTVHWTVYNGNGAITLNFSSSPAFISFNLSQNDNAVIFSDIYYAPRLNNIWGFTITSTPTSLNLSVTNTQVGTFTHLFSNIILTDKIQFGRNFNGGYFDIKNWSITSYGIFKANLLGDNFWGPTRFNNDLFVNKISPAVQTDILGYDNITGQVTQQPLVSGNESNVIYNNAGLFKGNDNFNYIESNGKLQLNAVVSPYIKSSISYQLDNTQNRSYPPDQPLTVINTNSSYLTNYQGSGVFNINQRNISIQKYTSGASFDFINNNINAMIEFYMYVPTPGGSGTWGASVIVVTADGNYTVIKTSSDYLIISDPSNNYVYIKQGENNYNIRIIRTSVSLIFFGSVDAITYNELFRTVGAIPVQDIIRVSLVNNGTFGDAQITNFQVHDVIPGTVYTSLEVNGPTQINNTLYTGSNALTVNGPSIMNNGLTLKGITGPVNNGNILSYNTSSGVISYDAKSFVIHHPVDTSKYLVHACLEGPEAGVYYRGKSEVIDDQITIQLPDYVKYIATDFTVHITSIYGKGNEQQYVSDVKNNEFTVFGKGKFFWIVYGKRLHIETEPFKISSRLNGSGPYLWLQNE